MSPIPYPLETRRFPVDFPLPASTTSSSSSGNGRVRNSSVNISFDNGRSSDEDGMDEEDEEFRRHEEEDSEDKVGGVSDDDKDEDDDGTGGALPKTTRLNALQLAKYAPFFVENEQGTLQPTFAMMYQTDMDTWRTTCEVSIMTFLCKSCSFHLENSENRRENEKNWNFV